MQKYTHIIESYACILKIFAIIFQLPINFSIFLWNLFNTKTIETFCFTIIIINSNPVSSNIVALIKIYYICPILYSLYMCPNQTISWINTIKPRFV